MNLEEKEKMWNVEAAKSLEGFIACKSTHFLSTNIYFKEKK